MQQSMNMERDNKFQYLNNLISKLSEDDEYIVLVFLLKSQFIEYGLKYFLAWYPYKPVDFYSDNFLNTATMGGVIKKMEELNDSYLVDIIENAKKFVTIRNEVTHHLLTSDKNIEEIKEECKEKLKVGGAIELEIHFMMDFVNDLIYGPYR